MKGHALGTGRQTDGMEGDEVSASSTIQKRLEWQWLPLRSKGEKDIR